MASGVTAQTPLCRMSLSGSQLIATDRWLSTIGQFPYIPPGAPCECDKQDMENAQGRTWFGNLAEDGQGKLGFISLCQR